MCGEGLGLSQGGNDEGLRPLDTEVRCCRCRWGRGERGAGGGSVQHVEHSCTPYRREEGHKETRRRMGAHRYGPWEAGGSQGDVRTQRAPWHKGEMKDLISHTERGSSCHIGQNRDIT